jgi:hypothetical protein
MKIVLLTIFTLSSVVASAQIGRHEQPVDTIPIGGDMQQRKMDHMEGKEELITALSALRDSVSSVIRPTSAVNASTEKKHPLSSRERELDEVISRLKKESSNESLLKRGYALLHSVRAELRNNR